MDRLTLLPTELKKQILQKITGPKYLLRLQAVSRNIAACTEEFCFPNIKEIEIHIAAVLFGSSAGDVGVSFVNGDAMPIEHVYGVIKELWKRGVNIIYLKLTGILHAELNRSSVYDQIVDIMSDHHRALKELYIDAYIRYIPSYLDGAENVVAKVSDSLEKLWYGCDWYDNPLVHRDMIYAIGGCIHLKEIHLNHICVTGGFARIICQNKRLSSVTILQYEYPFDQEVHDGIFSGILSGLEPTITDLRLHLTALFILPMPPILIEKTFPLLTTLIVVTNSHSRNDIKRIQAHLSWIIQHLFALVHIRISNSNMAVAKPLHCDHPVYIFWFFDDVLPTLDDSVIERKLRVRESETFSPCVVYFDIYIG